MTRPVRVPAALCGALALALVSPVALAKKKKKKGDDAPAAEAAAPATNVPDDGDSKKFADALMAAKIEGFRPTDGEGAKFEYDTLSFDAGNTWKAAGFVEIMDEKMECSSPAPGPWSPPRAPRSRPSTGRSPRRTAPGGQGPGEPRRAHRGQGRHRRHQVR